MARTPRASVPATSGQGVSRYGYQQAYSLKPVKGMLSGFTSPPSPARLNKPSRNYAKAPKSNKMDISYDDSGDPMFDPTSPKQVMSLDQGPPPQPSVKLSLTSARKIPK